MIILSPCLKHSLHWYDILCSDIFKFCHEMSLSKICSRLQLDIVRSRRRSSLWVWTYVDISESNCLLILRRLCKVAVVWWLEIKSIYSCIYDISKRVKLATIESYIEKSANVYQWSWQRQVSQSSYWNILEG